MTLQLSECATLLFHGTVVGDRCYVAWEWFGDNQRSRLGHAVVRLDRLTPPLTALRAALPGLIHADRSQSIKSMRTRARATSKGTRIPAERLESMNRNKLQQLLMVDRCHNGALADPSAEAALMRELGRVLLPNTLITEILSRATTQQGINPEQVSLRILPPANCAQVPWELLRIADDDDRRLLEICTVTTVPPTLTPSETGTATVPDAAAPLHVIDPALPDPDWGYVLSSRSHEKWRARLEAAIPPIALEPGLVASENITRGWLSDTLRTHPRSRMLYIGHVVDDQQGNTAAAMLLNDPPSTPGFGTLIGNTHGSRAFTAHDLFAGSLGLEPTTPEGYCSPTPASGAELWPMPPRVALLGCESGVEDLDPEPFGLVTAIMNAGARLVTATRWMLLTDRAFGAGEDALGPLHELTMAVDKAHDSADAVRSIAVWKRFKLEQWRQTGAFEHSPLTWAAITEFDAETAPTCQP